MSMFRSIVVGAALTLTPTLAHAFTYNICLNHMVHVVDSNVGEDFEVSTSGYGPWISRGSKVRINLGGSWTALPNTNTTTGCTTFVSPVGGAATVELTAQHTLANGQVVLIRNNFAFPQTKVWSFPTTLPASNSTIHLYTPYGDESNLAAIAPFIVHRLTSLTGNLPQAAGRQLTVFNEDCTVLPGTCSGSVTSGSNIFISPLPGLVHSERKFLVGHEVGHWLESGWRGGFGGGGGSYLFNDGDPQCAFVGLGDHAMFSREDDFLSYQEGIAHFISATAWNDPALLSGAFKYYKNNPPHNFDLYNLDSSTAAVPFNWENINCAPKLSGKSTEGDWLRLLWNYSNDPGWGAMPSTFDISEHVRAMFQAGGINAANAYATFKAALVANYPGFQFKWNALAAAHGPVDP